MNFVQGKIYVTRDGEEHLYVERRGGVLVFESVNTQTRLLTNLDGRFRWDAQDHPRDIIGNK
jgi:hypothetical protein